MPHTPGPWHYRFETVADDWGEIRTSDRSLVAKCAFGHWSEDDLNAHRRAKTDPASDNARLIAAAPDLYAALERIVGSVAKCQSGDVCQTSDFDDARAALAKARGEVE